MEFSHKPVLLDETIEGLDIKKDGIYVDGTLGGAGHSSVIASHLESGHLYGIDQDEDAIKSASERLEPYKDKVTIIRDNYENAVSRIISSKLIILMISFSKPYFSGSIHLPYSGSRITAAITGIPIKISIYQQSAVIFCAGAD